MKTKQDRKHLRITVHGKVQGVYFRAATKAVANQLGITGFVKNLPDGTVYIEAEGGNFELDNLIEWCHEGPEQAHVEQVEVQPGEHQG